MDNQINSIFSPLHYSWMVSVFIWKKGDMFTIIVKKHPVENCELYTLAKGIFIFKEIKNTFDLLFTAVMFYRLWTLAIITHSLQLSLCRAIPAV